MLAFFNGGYQVKPQLLGAAVALLLLAALVAFGPWPPVRGRGLVALAALAGLAAWTAVSVSWAPIRNLAADETAQQALYAAVFAVRSRPSATPPCAGWPCRCCSRAGRGGGYALAGRLLPDLIPVEVSSRAGARAQQPLTYWNALGLLMVFGVLLGVSLAADAGRPSRLRAAACAAAVPCAVVLYLTFSRGSLVALAAGSVALLLSRPTRSALAGGASRSLQERS